MGGRSSKAKKQEHVNYMEDIQQSYYEDKTILHEGPIHTICSVNENLIVSGGADKVLSHFKICYKIAIYSSSLYLY